MHAAISRCGGPAAASVVRFQVVHDHLDRRTDPAIRPSAKRHLENVNPAVAMKLGVHRVIRPNLAEERYGSICSTEPLRLGPAAKPTECATHAQSVCGASCHCLPSSLPIETLPNLACPNANYALLAGCPQVLSHSSRALC